MKELYIHCLPDKCNQVLGAEDSTSEVESIDQVLTSPLKEVMALQKTVNNDSQE